MTRSTRRKDRRGATPVPDVDNLDSEDAEARARAVRSLCPCRVGWTSYQEHLNEVARLAKDHDPKVRFNALHVRQDAEILEIRADRAERAFEAAERAQDERKKPPRVSARRVER